MEEHPSMLAEVEMGAGGGFEVAGMIEKIITIKEKEPDWWEPSSALFRFFFR